MMEGKLLARERDGMQHEHVYQNSMPVLLGG